jgi:type IV pilus assembly protein PilA
MTKRISAAGRTEDGFTIIELLVVVLIIGILAAVALPAFLNQKNKALDASAKELAHSAQIAAETYATDHSGSYAGLTAANLTQYDSTIQISSANGPYVVGVTNATATGFTVTTTTATATEQFSITRSNGLTTRWCTPSNGIQGGCTNGSW